MSAEDVEEFVEGCLEGGLSVKSTVNYLGFLHGIFAVAVRKRWAHRNRPALRIRVRRNEFGTPKSKRSSRSVPLADRVRIELEALFHASAYTSDEDLVFGHPHTGHPLDRSLLLKRFKRALRRAGVREVRFHDLRHLVDRGVMRPV